MEHSLQTICIPNRVIEKSGIFVSKAIAGTTVWDKLAVENPTHAVISAPNEAAAAAKSVDQIELIKSHVSDTTVLLDYGCGYGRVAKYLLPNQKLGGYVGLDSAYGMLQLFKQRYDSTPEEQSTPVLFVNADINDTPIMDASIDVAVVSAVFLHNHKSVVAKSMTELTRVIKPGGTALIYSSFPRVASLMGVQGQMYQIVLNLLGRPYKNGPVRYYTAGEVKRLFADFSALDLVPVGFAVLPKTIIVFPWPLEVVYRRGIANPLNTFLEKITPQSLKCYFATHFDVIAKR
jgi:ubiquinone/menaquinone biosynthesis C-methylase UbiE